MSDKAKIRRRLRCPQCGSLDNIKWGAGLGLTVGKLIISNLGGEIWLDTEYKGGARFVFTIPYEYEEDAPVAISVAGPDNR